MYILIYVIKWTNILWGNAVSAHFNYKLLLLIISLVYIESRLSYEIDICFQLSIVGIDFITKLGR